MRKPIIAIIYDFDKTLCTTDMQNYSFIPSLGMTPEEFWKETGKFCDQFGVEKILGYMYLMFSKCREKNIPLTKKFLAECGEKIEFFPGVETWFKRIKDFGAEHNVKIEHYLCSSGNKEIINGSKISKYFKAIFGCEFVYDPISKNAIWPKNAVNYTQKTQYLFRISKGILDISDDDNLNARTKKRRIEYHHMIYLGDGITDVPCMEIINSYGGFSIAIESSKSSQNTSKKLLDDKRVKYICRGDYKDGSKLDKLVKNIILLIENESRIAKFDKSHKEDK